VIEGEKNVKRLTRYAGLIAGASLLTAGLGGCNLPEVTQADQCMRREIFMQCMAALPAGPKATMYNDWDEVVSQCESAAYYQSLRAKSQIKQECRT